jgi:hypothetical protein
MEIPKFVIVSQLNRTLRGPAAEKKQPVIDLPFSKPKDEVPTPKPLTLKERASTKRSFEALSPKPAWMWVLGVVIWTLEL